MRHHRDMELRDDLAAGPDEQEGKERMEETDHRGPGEPAAEPGRPQKMAPVGFAHRGRMFCEQAVKIHVNRLARPGRYRVAKIPPRG